MVVRPPGGDPGATGWYLFTHPIVLVIVGVITALTLLNTRFSWIGRLGEKILGGYLAVTFRLLAVFGTLVVVRGVLALTADAPLGVAVALLVLLFCGYLALVWWLANESRRRRLWAWLRGWDRVTPFLFAFVLASVAIFLFATLAFILADRGSIHFGTGRATAAVIAGPEGALDFFSWHLLDAIPALDVNKTLRWDEPLGYTDSGVGALVLAFKLMVILPIVAAFAAFWRYSREPGLTPP